MFGSSARMIHSTLRNEIQFCNYILHVSWLDRDVNVEICIRICLGFMRIALNIATTPVHCPISSRSILPSSFCLHDPCLPNRTNLSDTFVIKFTCPKPNTIKNQIIYFANLALSLIPSPVHCVCLCRHC